MSSTAKASASSARASSRFLASCMCGKSTSGRNRHPGARALFVRGAHVAIRLRDQLFERGQVYIVEALEIEAELASLVLAQFVEQRIVLVQDRQDIDREVVLARGESNQERVTLVAAGILVVIASKADHAPRPDFRFEPRHLFHELEQGQRVLPLALIGNGVEELLDVLAGRLGFLFCHNTPPLRQFWVNLRVARDKGSPWRCAIKVGSPSAFYLIASRPVNAVEARA